MEQEATPCAGKAVQIFALPTILPDNARLLLDATTNSALLFRLESPKVISPQHSYQLTPSAARVFLRLLQSYPSCCSYRDLSLALYPHAPEDERDHGSGLRPIRRALAALLPALRALGLRAVALRGQGYLLVASELKQPVSLSGMRAHDEKSMKNSH